jgi:hypothetical protein
MDTSTHITEKIGTKMDSISFKEFIEQVTGEKFEVIYNNKLIYLCGEKDEQRKSNVE